MRAPGHRAAARFAAAALAVAALALGPLAGCAGRRLVSDRFAIHQRDLPQLAELLPTGAAARMTAEPRRFLDLLADALSAPAGTLTPVDKSRGLDAAFVPTDLVDLADRGLRLSKSGLSLRAVALDDLLAMNAAARAAGVTLVVSSTFRTFEQQESLWRQALATQPRAQVERELAPPGHSQHQLGTVVDFGSIDDGFAATDQGRWVAANAWRYGWSLSYPEGREEATGYRWESWHFRWIGRSAAELARDFFGGSQQEFLEFVAERGEWLGERLRPPPPAD
jgi:zinc D-Ala-D-Ala carboxypeptidase